MKRTILQTIAFLLLLATWPTQLLHAKPIEHPASGPACAMPCCQAAEQDRSPKQAIPNPESSCCHAKGDLGADSLWSNPLLQHAKPAASLKPASPCACVTPTEAVFPTKPTLSQVQEQPSQAARQVEVSERVVSALQTDFFCYLSPRFSSPQYRADRGRAPPRS